MNDAQHLIRECQESPARFRDELLIQTGRGRQRFGDCMADFQRRDFERLDPALIALTHGTEPPTGRFWLERTKGGSKDSDLAICLLWLLAFSRRSLRMQIGAYDSQQADEIRQIIKQTLRLPGRLNQELAAVTEVKRATIVNVRTESECEILTTDSKGSHGARPDLVLVNELSHIGDQEFAETLLDNADKVPNGVVVIATNAGYLGTWQHKWRELASASQRWCFSALSEPAPWINSADLAESRQRNSNSRYLRLWRGVWIRGKGDALDTEDIEACTTRSGPVYGQEPHCAYLAGLDLGTKRDHAGLCVLGADYVRRKVFVADARSWTPRAGGEVDLMAVQQGVRMAARTYGCAVGYDPSQAVLMAQQLRQEGIACVEVPFVAGNLNRMASAMLQAFRERKIELYPDEYLKGNFSRLSIAERSFGYKLEASHDAEFGHADVAIAAAIVLPDALEIAMTTHSEVASDGLGNNVLAHQGAGIFT